MKAVALVTHSSLVCGWTTHPAVPDLCPCSRPSGHRLGVHGLDGVDTPSFCVDSQWAGGSWYGLERNIMKNA